MNAKEAITDKNGDFIIPSMFGFHLWPGFLDGPNVIVYKPGYRSYKEHNYQPHEGSVIKLSKATTKKQRIESINSFDICDTMTDEKCMKKLPYMWELREREWKDLGLIK